MPKSVSASNQCVESGRISHGLLQMLKPLLGIGESLGVKVGNAKKVGCFEILLQGNRGLQIADGSLKITAVEINSPERVLGASVTWVLGDDGLCELVGFLDIACAKTRHREVHHDVGIVRS